MIDLRDETMNRIAYAVKLLNDGYMCSESIFLAFSEKSGIPKDVAAKLSGGFAGGMAQGKTCGAVTGAIMILGLHYGAGMVRDPYSRDNCFLMIQEFSEEFCKNRKTTECSEILKMQNVDATNPEEMKRLREKRICDKIVRESAEILERLL